MELNTVEIKENVWWKEGIVSLPGIAHSGKKFISNHPEYGELELGIARIEDTPEGVKACILFGENNIALYEVKKSTLLAPNSYEFSGMYLIEDSIDKETVKETVHFVFFKKVKEGDSETYKCLIPKGYIRTQSSIITESSIDGFFEGKKEIKNINAKKIYIDFLNSAKKEENQEQKQELKQENKEFIDEITSKKKEKLNINDLQYEEKPNLNELEEMSEEWTEQEDEDAERKQGLL